MTYKLRIGTRYKQINSRELRKFYADICNKKMQDFINDGNEWGKWFFRYEDLDKTSDERIFQILREENYDIKMV